MSINISGIHFSITEAIHAHSCSRIKKLAKRYPLITANITLSKSHHDFTCSAEYKGHQLDATSTATNKDLYKAISISMERLERQLNDKKEAFKGKGKQGIKTLEEPSDIEAESAFNLHQAES
jgi:ribosomal subunit interface protein